MSDTKITISLDIKNQAALDTIIANLSKKYSLDLTLPLDQLSSSNSLFNSLSTQLSTLKSHLSTLISLTPDLYYLISLKDRLISSVNLPSTQLTASDDSHFAYAANALSILSIASGWTSAQSLRNSNVFNRPPQTLSSQPSAFNSPGYSPSGVYLSPLDTFLSALDQLYSFPDYISSQKADLTSAIVSHYQNIADDPHNSVPVEILETRLDSELQEALVAQQSQLFDKLSDIYSILSLWLPQYASAPVSLPISPESQLSAPDSQLITHNSQLSSLNSFIASYNSEMAHLSQLRSLGLISYSDVIEKAWEYFRALQAIAQADGEVSEAEQELLNIYRSRAQRAQLAQNREGSDLTRYYNEIKALDQSYYEWKKARIIEDVNDMDLAEEQKTALLKKRLGELDDELHADNKDRSLLSYMLGDMGFDESDRKGIIESYSMLADQISGIWQQLYSNIDASRQASLEKLERRAKEERRSEAWLASEKDKINAEYDKKARQMKRAEKSMQIASASMNTAEGVTNALTLKPAWMAPIMAAAVGSLGLYQVKLIADQKLAEGGVVNHGLFRGKGTSTSDSNLIAISDSEYIVSARRVRELGLPLLDALNFGDGETVRKALASLNYSLNHSALIQAPAAPNRSGAYSSGGAVVGASGGRAFTQKIVLVCDNREIARAVAKGNKRLLTT